MKYLINKSLKQNLAMHTDRYIMILHQAIKNMSFNGCQFMITSAQEVRLAYICLFVCFFAIQIEKNNEWNSLKLKNNTT